MHLPNLSLLAIFSASALAALNKTGSTCTVTPLATGKDDTPQILDAFKQCGQNGKVVLTEGLFNIGQVMRTTDLNNCDIEIHGTLKWSSDSKQLLDTIFTPSRINILPF